MDRIQVAEKVRRIIVEHLGVSDDQVVDGATFKEDLGADSLDRVELQMAMEQAFGIEINDTEGEQLLTVGQLTEHCIAKVWMKPMAARG